MEAARQAELLNKAILEQARARWAPAHDRQWLKQADLIQVARAWSAALPYASEHAAAASALRKCEERLQQLHPHGMDHYDRFRQAGLGPEEAMREAAPFFTRDPNVRTGDPATRRELTHGTNTWWVAGEQESDLPEDDDYRQVQRALSLIDELQAQHLAHDTEALRPEDFRTILEIATNLPGRIITKALNHFALENPQEERSAPADTRNPATQAAASSRTNHEHNSVAGNVPAARTPAQVAADDFPYDIRTAIHQATQQPNERSQQAPPPEPSRSHQPRH